MTIRKSVFILSVIVFLALGLRLYRVQQIPPGLSWDEVSIGYNAYSILKTGKDEHGRFLPFDTFIAYGDHKPPVSVYATVPFVALFGLNELAVRLPSVVFGTGIVLLTYVVALELFKMHSPSMRLGIARLASLSVAVSPWHINISRAGFEANIGLFFVLLGVCLVLFARKRPALWMFAWLPFVAAVYTFNSSRYFVPFMGIGILWYCWKSIRTEKKFVFIGMTIGIVALLPITPHLLSKEARIRFTEVNIFSDQSVVIQSNNRIVHDGGTFLANVIHNRRIGYLRSFLIHYFDHFTPEFLFIKGDGNPKFSTQDVGQFYIIDALFLLIGFFVVFLDFRKEALLISYWLVTAIIPAATARETPHALRILNSLPAWHLMIGVGMAYVITRAAKNRNYIIPAVTVLYVLSAAYYLHNYYVHYPRLYSHEWQYGYKQALAFARTQGANADKVYMSESIGRAYMYTLFYTQYDPAAYLIAEKEAYFDAAGFYHVDAFDRYVFTRDGPLELKEGAIYIYPPSQVPEGATVLQTIRLLNGEAVLTIFEKR